MQRCPFIRHHGPRTLIFPQGCTVTKPQPDSWLRLICVDAMPGRSSPKNLTDCLLYGKWLRKERAHLVSRRATHKQGDSVSLQFLLQLQLCTTCSLQTQVTWIHRNEHKSYQVMTWVHSLTLDSTDSFKWHRKRTDPLLNWACMSFFGNLGKTFLKWATLHILPWGKQSLMEIKYYILLPFPASLSSFSDTSVCGHCHCNEQHYIL